MKGKYKNITIYLPTLFLKTRVVYEFESSNNTIKIELIECSHVYKDHSSIEKQSS